MDKGVLLVNATVEPVDEAPMLSELPVSMLPIPAYERLSTWLIDVGSQTSAVAQYRKNPPVLKMLLENFVVVESLFIQKMVFPAIK